MTSGLYFDFGKHKQCMSILRFYVICSKAPHNESLSFFLSLSHFNIVVLTCAHRIALLLFIVALLNSLISMIIKTP